ncbi:hypothetical protein IVA80_01505 [Bradyrhizobium sp. 139]|uniref:hypothetical protein n=1 Tax=Bradyrhizobium sp. 139 TaxID=2782616 RepID=UPI001FF7841A|nr:hypothetical protein [Bradyrhizobium sp. 139]MCK1739581.1 hypothetical protein [Bradyrhizobium sp. 139]
MKRLMFPLMMALTVIGAATGVIKSHALFPFGQSGMPSIRELQAHRSAALPDQEIEDRSVMFAKERTR